MNPGMLQAAGETGGQVPSPAATTVQYLTFRLANERFGIAISAIVEILKYRPATSVPRAAAVVHGIISLRGKIITVLDGRVRLGQPPMVLTGLSRIVVLDDGQEAVGVLVDEVLQVERLPVNEIKAPPATVTQAMEQGIAGVCDTRQDSILIILDAVQFLRI